MMTLFDIVPCEFDENNLMMLIYHKEKLMICYRQKIEMLSVILIKSV
jgi:hypothetical protein